jgi:tetratricopeptide (TPR) repeat protein
MYQALVRWRVVRFLLPTVFIAATAALGAEAPAAQAVLSHPSLNVIEIKGGQGRGAWTLHYGTAGPWPTKLVPVEGDRAWFVHGPWLRLIDTRKGVVVGRWHFPGQIRKLAPEGRAAQIELEVQEPLNPSITRSVVFDPAAPRVPSWPSFDRIHYTLPRAEARSGRWSYLQPAASSEAKTVIPNLEEMIRRDPFSPWFRVALARLRYDVYDPRGPEMARAVAEAPGTDYAELLPMAAFLLTVLREPVLARAVFDRGYRDFLERGNDPRFLVSAGGRLLLFPWTRKPLDGGKDLAEVAYQLSPSGEGTRYAWPIYARMLASTAETGEAWKWRQRAEEAERSSYFIAPELLRPLELAFFVALSCVAAGILYFLVLLLRYGRREKSRAVGWWQRFKEFALFPFDRWSRSERVAFLLIPLTVWLALGIGGLLMRRVQDYSRFPFSSWMGSFASPATLAALEKMPAGASRDLLLAIAYQQAGETAKAEALYRSLPQFAESWNNLGVILKNAGKEKEAREAFERALQLDPGLADAGFNLGRPPATGSLALRAEHLGRTPVIAPPSRAVVLGAFRRASPVEYAAGAVTGPYSGALNIFNLAGG